MPYRKVPLVDEGVYHVYSRSIAGYTIFNDSNDYGRMVRSFDFYSREDLPCQFNLFEQLQVNHSIMLEGNEKQVEIIAYCVMPTHIHIVLKQKQNGGISRYMFMLLKSYSTYFNKKYRRRGPLWEGRFKNVLVKDDNQLLHLTRYVHINPTTDNLVESLEGWPYSSYDEYIGKRKGICVFRGLMDLSPKVYKKFAEERISVQKEIKNIRKQCPGTLGSGITSNPERFGLGFQKAIISWLTLSPVNVKMVLY